MLSEARLRRILYPLTALIILSLFLFFTWKSIRFYFDPDDMMNLYLAWSKPLGQVLKANIFFWSDFFRPFGALFYRMIYDAAGFNPLPFRAACLAIGIFNIGLCFWFAQLASGSDRVAALTVLLFAFHTRLMEVWYRTGVVYDLLSFTFFYLAACLYIGVRKHGRYPGTGRFITIAVCYICALNSKEVAVALPVLLLAYELLFERAAWRGLRPVALLALFNIPYILGKTRGVTAMTNNPAYRPEYSLAQFCHAWSVYLNYILMTADRIMPWMAISILLAMLAIAATFGSRKLLFAWIILFTATLPVIFLPYRGAFVLYVSFAGWTLYAALVLVALQDAITRSHRQYRTALASLVFLIVGWRWAKVNLHDQRVDPKHWLYDPAMKVHEMADRMRALHPRLPKGAKTLFLEDPFETDEWTPYFIMKLLYHDGSMTVDRIKMLDSTPPDWTAYQYVFTYEDGKYRQLKPYVPDASTTFVP